MTWLSSDFPKNLWPGRRNGRFNSRGRLHDLGSAGYLADAEHDGRSQCEYGRSNRCCQRVHFVRGEVANHEGGLFSRARTRELYQCISLVMFSRLLLILCGVFWMFWSETRIPCVFRDSDVASDFSPELVPGKLETLPSSATLERRPSVQLERRMSSGGLVTAHRKAKSLGYRAETLMRKTRKAKLLAEMSMNSRPETNREDRRKLRT